LHSNKLNNANKVESDVRAHFDKIRDKDAWVWEVVDTVAPPPPSQYNFRTIKKNGDVTEPTVHKLNPF